MAFFASFVQGVFQGMDWREARDDRSRRREIQEELLERDRTRWDWDQEDRTHTLGERQHALSERQRAMTEREADLEAWNETTDEMLEREQRGGRGRSREISILHPDDMAISPSNADNAGRAGNSRPTQQAPNPEAAQRSLGVTGSSTGDSPPRPVVDSSKRGGGRADPPVPEMLLNDGTFMGFVNNAGARPDEYWRGLNDSQRQQFMERAAGPQSVRGPLRGVTDPGADPATSANPSYREPTSERPRAGGPPGRTIGLPLDSAVMPPEATPLSQRERDATGANPSYREPTREREDEMAMGQTAGLPLDRASLPPEQPTRSQGGRVRYEGQPQVNGGTPLAEPRMPPAASRGGPARYQRPPGNDTGEPLDRARMPPQSRRPAYAAADWQPTPLSTQGEPLREVQLPGDTPPPPDEARQRADQIAGVVPGIASRVADGVRGIGRRVSEDLALTRDVGGAVVERGLGTGLSVLGAPEAGAAAFRREDEATQRVRENQQRHAASREIGLPPEAGQAPGAQAAAGKPDAAPGVQQAAGGAPTTEQGTPIASLQSVQSQSPANKPGGNTGNGAERQTTESQREQAADRAVQDYRSRRMAPIVERYLRTGRPDQARAFEAWMNERGVQEGMRSWARAIHAYSANDFEGLLEGLVGAYEANDYYDDGLSIDREQTEVNRDDRGNIIGATIAFRDNATGRTFQQEINGIRDMAAVAIGTLSPEAVFERMWEQTFGQDGNNEQEEARQRAYGQAYERLSRADYNWGQLSPDEQHQRVLDHLQRATGASGIGAGAVPVYAGTP